MKKDININIGSLVKYQIAVPSDGTEAAKRELAELLQSAIRAAEQENLAAPSQRPETTTKRQSIFMQMRNGRRPDEGSFNTGLMKLFYLADKGNQVKLVRAFPEFFGAEVPEFEITAAMVQPERQRSQRFSVEKWYATLTYVFLDKKINFKPALNPFKNGKNKQQRPNKGVQL